MRAGPLRRAVDAAIERRVVERALRRSEAWLNFRGEYRLTDRGTGSDRLAIVLAGYKPHLWDMTLARLRRFAPDDLDVCLVSPALESPELAQLAEEEGWSYLSTAANYVALAQNLAIRSHPAARWVYKLDEDIFLADGYFDLLLDGYRRVEQEGRFRPGFCAPVSNVNGFSYVTFLEALGLEQEYKDRFGELLHAGRETHVNVDGHAARWLWERSLPFDEVAATIASRPFGYSTVPHRFSIGAILFERAFWAEINGLRVRPPEGHLGVDEAYICRRCVDLSRVMVVVHNVFAGHFSFGPQDAEMRAALPELRPHLLPSDVGAPSADGGSPAAGAA